MGTKAFGCECANPASQWHIRRCRRASIPKRGGFRCLMSTMYRKVMHASDTIAVSIKGARLSPKLKLGYTRLIIDIYSLRA